MVQCLTGRTARARLHAWLDECGASPVHHAKLDRDFDALAAAPLARSLSTIDAMRVRVGDVTVQ